MRILSWNINGIRSLPQYHPWNSLKTGDAILAALDADIICFQEIKVQRAALERHFAVPAAFDSFFSFPAAKPGYSGVAVYTNTATAAPLKAEEGLTGTLQPTPPLSPAERISPAYPQPHDAAPAPGDPDAAPAPTLAALDAEGRALVLDFGLFVLINVYCPADRPGAPPARAAFKMAFHRLLAARVAALVRDEHREVLVVGDLNAAAAPADVADAGPAATFWDAPPRAWLRAWLAPAGGPLVDAVREAWPARAGMYTCWNTKLGARAANYGARVDYALLTRGLRAWVRAADIRPAVRGSDHCPVVVELHDAIGAPGGGVVRLHDAMCHAAARRAPPRLSARRWREFGGTQRVLSAFFAPRAAAEGSGEGSGSGSQSPAGGEGGRAAEPEGGRAAEPGGGRAAEGSAEGSQVEGEGVQGAQVEGDSSQAEGSGSGSGSGGGSQDAGGSGSQSLAAAAASAQQTPAPRQKKKADAAAAAEQPRRKKRKTGQTTLAAFFAPRGGAQSASAPADTRSQVAADHALARSLSAPALSAPAATSAHAKAAWTRLLAPLQPPACAGHGEPCAAFTVAKAGPNKGKTFFVCARPVGPGYDKGRAERRREDVDVRFRCDYFKWASEVKREALRGAGGGGEAAAEAGSCS